MNFIMIGLLLLREALDRLRVCLNMYLITIIFTLGIIVVVIITIITLKTQPSYQ